MIRKASYLLLTLLLVQGCNMVRAYREMVRGQYAAHRVEPRMVALSQGPMRCYEGGNGDPVLLVHGFGFSGLVTWAGQVPVLADRYRLVVPDLFWFGESRPSAPDSVLTAAAQADALAELLDALGISRAHVVGVSFGGFVALEFARRHPGRVNRLVLVDSSGLRPNPTDLAEVRAHFGSDFQLAEVLIPRDERGLKRFLDKVYYRPRPFGPVVLREILEEDFWKNRPQRERILAKLGDTFLEPADLAAIRAPTAVLWGRHDPLIPLAIGRRMAGAIRGAELKVFEESAHVPMIEEPRRFNLALQSFFEEGKLR